MVKWLLYMLSTKFKKISVLAISFAVILNTFVFIKPVSAESDAPVMKWTLRDRAASYYYFNAIKTCVHESSDDLIDGFHRISDKNAKDGRWWSEGSTWSKGLSWTIKTAPTYLDKAVPEDDEGRALCNTVVKKAAKLWKTTPLKMLCNMQGPIQRQGGGIKAGTPGQDCETGSADFYGDFSDAGVEKLKTFITTTYYKESNGKVVDMLTAMGNESGSYIMLHSALTHGCGYSVNDSAKPGGSNVVTNVKTVDLDSGDVSTHTYSGPKDKETKIYTHADGKESVKISCAGIAQAMNKWADGASKLIKKYNVSYRSDKDKKDGSAAGSEKPDAKYCQENPDSPSCSGNAPTQDEGTSTCPDGIGAIGWIVCPTVNFMGKLTDGLYGIVSDFLYVKPGLLKTNEATNIWEAFRNIANILLIAAFIFIIYSQMTGIGLSNYGVKRMLPKLIVITVMINLSLYISQVCLDLSNILGGSLYGFINTLGGSKDYFPGFDDIVGGVLTGVTQIAIVGVAGVALTHAAVGIIALILLGAILGLAITVLILIGRNAIIVMLALISPLAFVAMLLPNTEKFFKKWWDMFLGLLVVYPMIAVVFGLSKLAAKAFSGSHDTIAQFVALGVSTIPMLSSTILLQGAMAATGTIGAFAKGSARTFSNMARTGARRGIMEGSKRTKIGYGFARAMENREEKRKRNLARSYGRATGVVGRAFDWVGGESDSGIRESIAEKIEAEDLQRRVELAQKRQVNLTWQQRQNMATTGMYGGRKLSLEELVGVQELALAESDVRDAYKFMTALPSTAEGFSDHDRRIIFRSAAQGLRKGGFAELIGSSNMGILANGGRMTNKGEYTSKLVDGKAFTDKMIMDRISDPETHETAYNAQYVMSSPKIGKVLDQVVSEHGGWTDSSGNLNPKYGDFSKVMADYLDSPAGPTVNTTTRNALGEGYSVGIVGEILKESQEKEKDRQAREQRGKQKKQIEELQDGQRRTTKKILDRLRRPKK